MNPPEVAIFKITGAYWTAVVNMIRFKCKCGTEHYMRANRRKITCPTCYATEDVYRTRDWECWLAFGVY